MTIHRTKSALAAAVFTSATLLGTSLGFAATPPTALVVAQSIDDAVSFDPAEASS